MRCSASRWRQKRCAIIARRSGRKPSRAEAVLQFLFQFLNGRVAVRWRQLRSRDQEEPCDFRMKRRCTDGMTIWTSLATPALTASRWKKITRKKRKRKKNRQAARQGK